ncbi:MAG: YraN family protein [Candidatus Moraniibacteriota bacterium]
MPAQSADSLGRLGEKLAARYLSERGYRILEERYTNTRGYRLGEVDIIAEYQGYLRFIEVKTSLLRKEDLFSPEERLSPRKLHLLEGMAERYIREKRFF